MSLRNRARVFLASNQINLVKVKNLSGIQFFTKIAKDVPFLGAGLLNFLEYCELKDEIELPGFSSII